MSRFHRAFLVSCLLVAVLGLASLSFYHHPSQVEGRIRRDLGPFLTRVPDLRLEDCSSSLAGELRIGRLTLAASPLLREAAILEIDDLRVLGDTLALTDPPSGTGGARRRCTAMSADRLLLRLETSASRLVGRGRAAAGVWNFQDLVPAALQRRALTAPGVLCKVSNFRISLRATDSPAVTGALVLEGEGLEVSGWFGGGMIEVRGVCRVVAASGAGAAEGGGEGVGRDLGPHGRFRLLVSPRGGVQEGRASFRNLRHLGCWTPILPSSFRLVETLLGPRGLLDLEFALGAGAPDGDRLDARLRCLDTTLSIDDGEFELEHVSGTVNLDAHSARIGEPDDVAVSPESPTAAVALNGKLAGLGARLSAHLRPDRSAISILLSRFDLADVARLPGPAWVRALLEGAGMRGHASARFLCMDGPLPGGVGGPRQSAAGRRRRRRLDISDARSLALPAIEGLRATIESVGPDFDGGDATVSVESLDLGGLGMLRGRAKVTVADGTVDVTLGEDVRVGERGQVTGGLSVDLARRVVRGKLSGRHWTLALSRGLLTAQVDRIDVTFSDSGPADTGEDRHGRGLGRFSVGVGTATLARRKIPAFASTVTGAATAIEFESGRAAGHITTSGLRAVSLSLDSPRAVLRFHGDVSWDGVLDGVALLGLEGAAQTVRALEPEATPSTWAAALAAPETPKKSETSQRPETSGDDKPDESDENDRVEVLLLLLSGTLSRPTIRLGRLEELDS